jgi:type II secretory pathway pseudopilin PulG
MQSTPVRRIRNFPSGQRGAALILMVAILIVGVAWSMIGALGKAAPSQAELDIRTAQALQAAKRALLGYVAQYAARTNFDVPGRLPCPESKNSIGDPNNEGQAASSCSNTVPVVGRLPWETLGVDKILDSNGEPLWYMLSPGFHPLPPSPINFGTPAQLSLDGTAMVAIIIAPGRALDTLPVIGTPITGCNKVNQTQFSNRYVPPLDPTKFFECGDIVLGSFLTLGTSPWSNDRAIGITAAEWADAISGAVADRLQRTVAPVLAGWDQAEYTARGKSWGVTHVLPYLPFASTFSDPATNVWCGDANVLEGLLPIATQAQGCTNDWSGSVSLVSGLTSLPCTNAGAYLSCFFQNLLGTPPFSARITATALRIAGSYRSTIASSDITATGGGTATVSMSLSSATGAATAIVDVSWPPGLPSLVEVRVPHPLDAAVLSDPQLQWFLNNNWNRYTYYAVAQGVTAGATPPCAGITCLTANGLSDTGNPNDKRFVLVLMGRALATQSQPSNDPAQYIESHSFGTAVFSASIVTTTFNDRIAACPFQYTPQSGIPIPLCN